MAVGAVTTTTFAAKLKRWYVDKNRLFDMKKYKNVLLGLLTKDPNLSGEGWDQPITAAGGSGGSADYDNSVDNSSPGVLAKFYGSPKNQYEIAKISDAVMRLSRDGRGAFESAKVRIDEARDAFLQKTNFKLYRTEAGNIARIGTSGSTGIMTLDATTNKAAQFIRKDDVLSVTQANNGSGLHGTATVTAVDAVAGTVTMTVAATYGDVQANDYIIRKGDASGSLAGLESWVPPTAYGAGLPFKNVTRSDDSQALAGIRLSGAGIPVEEALIQAVSDCRTYGGEPDVVMLHDTKMASLIKGLSDRIRWGRTDGMSFTEKKKATFGFAGIQLAVGGEPVMIHQDAACQQTYGWVLDLSKWRLYTAGTWPYNRGNGTDGLDMVRSGVNYLVELFGLGELVCAAPGHNAVVDFGS